MAKQTQPGASPDRLKLYEQVVALLPGVERKGAAMPYTSLNGHMFSFMTPSATVALRLPEVERGAFLKRYRTQLAIQHGVVMKEYALVPDVLLRKTQELKTHFECSLAYVGSLKPKPTTRKKSTASDKAKAKKSNRA
jgi:hypothetical protein